MCDSRLENVSARQLTLILRVLAAFALVALLWLGALALRGFVDWPRRFS
jgi:hypothetical protein